MRVPFFYYYFLKKNYLERSRLTLGYRMDQETNLRRSPKRSCASRGDVYFNNSETPPVPCGASHTICVR